MILVIMKNQTDIFCPTPMCMYISDSLGLNEKSKYIIYFTEQH